PSLLPQQEINDLAAPQMFTRLAAMLEGCALIAPACLHPVLGCPSPALWKSQVKQQLRQPMKGGVERKNKVSLPLPHLGQVSGSPARPSGGDSSPGPGVQSQA